ncbi:MAG: rhodanese-like domain-containing protein [Synechococcales bacterium]|nr:rhodanese-like domain-containing protein [Synechococcales bacterium]
MSQPQLIQVSVEELAEKLANSSEPLQLVDVREPDELAIAALPGFINLPLSQYGVWAEDIHNRLDAQQETWVLCHHGMRSAQMCQWLMGQGFSNVKNISGGIHAYAVQVDSQVPQY